MTPAIVAIPLSLGTWIYFLWVFLAAVAFMINLKQIYPQTAVVFPYAIDEGPAWAPMDPMTEQNRWLTNVALLGLFAILHSVLARTAVKRYLNWDPNIERSLYVLIADVCLHLVIAAWQPLMDGKMVYKTDSPTLYALYGVGLAWILTSTFALDHFRLFGITQATGFDIMGALNFAPVEGGFVKRLHYRLVRHPIMTGFFALFWFIPNMTVGHLVFSSACSVYILLAVHFLEEPHLASQIGKEYDEYMKTCPAYIPGFPICPIPHAVPSKMRRD